MLPTNIEKIISSLVCVCVCITQLSINEKIETFETKFFIVNIVK